MESIFAKKMNPLRGSIDTTGIALVGAVGAYKFTENGHQVKERKDNSTDHSQLMLLNFHHISFH